MIENYRIAGTRISVWDVLHHLENDWPPDDVADALCISSEQLDAAIAFIEAHRTEVLQRHREIEDRNAKGNPPQIESKLKNARILRAQQVATRRKTFAG